VASPEHGESSSSVAQEQRRARYTSSITRTGAACNVGRELTAFAGELENWTASACGWRLQISSKLPKQRGCMVLPRRSVVERTCVWLLRSPRLSKDSKELTETTEACVYLAMIRVVLRRLSPWHEFQKWLL
jgi:transposase